MIRRTISNAFTRSGSGGRNPQRSLASALAPMRAALARSPRGHALQLCPMLPLDALSALRAADQALPEDAGRFQTLVLEAEPAELERGLRTEPGAGSPARWLAGRLESGSGEALPCLSDQAAGRLLGFVPMRRLRVVRIEGPVEPRDAAAIAAAARQGRSPLDVELRAVAEMTVKDDQVVSVEVRREEQALIVIGENLRHYLAALCDRPAPTFAAPPPGLVREMLTQGGLTIRPIETQVFSTFIDIGVCTTSDEPTRPAERSLIYDLPSHTWHADR
jgi:hypothetical protein